MARNLTSRLRAAYGALSIVALLAVAGCGDGADELGQPPANDGVNEHGLLGSDVSQVKEGPETVNVYFNARSKDDDNGQPFHLTTWAGCRIKLP